MPEAGPQPQPVADFLRRDDSFAPPVAPFPTLPPVRITPRPSTPLITTQPLAQPSPMRRLLRGAARLAGRLNPLLLLVTPGNMGPEGTGNLVPGQPQWRPPGEVPPPPPDLEPEIDVWEPVIVRPPPRRPPRVAVGNDPVMPPNWWDMAQGGDSGRFIDWFNIIDRTRQVGERAYDVYDFFSRLADRRASQRAGSSGELLDPVGPLLLPQLYPEPGPATRRQTRVDPSPVLPDPFGLPGFERIGSPSTRTSPAPRTRTGTRPGIGTTRNPFTGSPPLTGTPFLPDFIAPPPNYRPPVRPGGTTRPDFLTDSTPDLLADPEYDFDNPTATDQCQCDKPPKKKKPRKKREVCRQGTYTQRAKGIKYAPRRVVPCEGEIQPEKKSSKKAKRPRLRPGQFPTEDLSL